MKKLKLIIILFIILLMNSCNRNGEIEVPEITDKQKIEELQKSGVKGIPFPEGSKAIKLSSNGENVTKIILPEDVYFVVKNEKGEVFRVEELGVKCSCSKGKGCSPVKHNDEYYCVMNDRCKVCSLDTQLTQPGTRHQKISIVGIMNERESISVFAKTKGMFTTVEGARQYGITEDFFKCKEVEKGLKDLYSFIYPNVIPDFIQKNSTEIPNTYVYVKVNFFGNNILIPIPKDTVDDDTLIYNLSGIEDGGKTICTCLQGKGCKLKSFLTAVYCDAGDCTDCVLKD